MNLTPKRLAVAVAEVLKTQKRISIAQIAKGAKVGESKAIELLFMSMNAPTWAQVTWEYPPIHGAVVVGLIIRAPR